MTRELGLFIYALIVVVVAVVLLLIVRAATKRAKKDWERVRSLEEETYKVSTPEEIAELYSRVVEFIKVSNNEYIIMSLSVLEGYLRGMHSQIKKQEKW